MKNNIINKKYIRRLVVLLLAFCLILVNVNQSVYADHDDTKQRLEQAKKEKEEKQKELDSAKKQLKSTQDGLASLANTKNTYEGKLYSLNGELQEVADKIAVIESELDLKNTELNETQILLEESVKRCEDQYAAMKERIKFLYESGNTTYLEILASADSFGEFLNYAEYIERLSAYDRKMLNEYVETQHDVEDKKAQVEKELADIEKLKAEAEDEHSKVSGLIADTSNSLAATEASIDSLEDMADAYEAECDRKSAEAAAAEKEYAAIKAQYEEELRLSRLAAQSKWRDISEVTFDEGDRYLIANLIYCEAGAEPYSGKVAVGAVVVNRVLSSRYPDTVTGVIYQYKQFSPVLDGHLASALASDKANSECYAAADAAMSGTTNIGNCLYFRTPIPGLTGMQIGGHIFY